MAPNIEQSPYFLARQNLGHVVVRDPPKFDLESYISNYEGRTRLDRLFLIGSTSTYLAVDALRMGVAEAKRGKDTDYYMKIVETLHEVLPDDPMGIPDLGWVDQTNRWVKQENDRLEHELKAYKNNLIKESIRMGNEDMGNFFYSIGNLSEAFKSYFRMREHCTSAKHLSGMTLRLVFISIAQRIWMGAQSHIVKVEAHSLKGEEKARLDPIVSACSGLAHMGLNAYRDAANAFLQTSPTYLTVEPATGIKFQKEVLTGNDVAVYGGLCALASMDRKELQEHVLANNNFRNFLELEPHIRRAISLFCSSKYSACLEVLEAYRTDYLLDVYLAPCLREIYAKIRSKAIVQYFIPFSCVTLDEMAKKFQMTGEGISIEDELIFMINSGILDAKIDLVERLLISPPINPRHAVHTAALTMAENYNHTLRLRLTRLNMLNAGLEVRSPKSSNQGDGQVGGESMLGGTLRRIGTGIGITS
ncbi:PCI-domain-containing protein [Lepidopterella palustris CBS 459.81]|uniref:COP9 signalosome complex subunit 1 n=1 Tax=Lepidopterella palustris CBS 459.81 TaxID=1314670 RepID=A0A8E2JI77_9PEZI|nr:PCI-domain-containing protein [Lepidopterella palustris CBS 459.81]